jgi:hypothetical protein
MCCKEIARAVITERPERVSHDVQIHLATRHGKQQRATRRATFKLPAAANTGSYPRYVGVFRVVTRCSLLHRLSHTDFRVSVRMAVEITVIVRTRSIVGVRMPRSFLFNMCVVVITSSAAAVGMSKIVECK